MFISLSKFIRIYDMAKINSQRSQHIKDFISYKSNDWIELEDEST